MRVESEQTPYWLGLPSRGRPKNILRTLHPDGSIFIGNATWYVPGDEVDDYQRVAHDHGISELVRVQEETRTGGLVPTRNQILEDAWDRNLPCAQLDDDLTGVDQIVWLRQGKDDAVQTVSYVIPVQTAFEVLLRRLDRFPFYLAAGRPGASMWGLPQYIRSVNTMSAHAFIVKPNSQMFDERLQHSEDMEYALRHIKVYGGVLNSQDIHFSPEHWTNEGGMVDQRSDEMDEHTRQFYAEHYSDYTTYAPNYYVRYRYPRIKKDWASPEGVQLLKVQLPENVLKEVVHLAKDHPAWLSVSETLTELIP